MFLVAGLLREDTIRTKRAIQRFLGFVHLMAKDSLLILLSVLLRPDHMVVRES